MVGRRSPSLAQVTARHLRFDARPSQACYAMPDHLAHADPLVEKLERWSRRHLDGATRRALLRKKTGRGLRRLRAHA